MSKSPATTAVSEHLFLRTTAESSSQNSSSCIRALQSVVTYAEMKITLPLTKLYHRMPTDLWGLRAHKQLLAAIQSKRVTSVLSGRAISTIRWPSARSVSSSGVHRKYLDEIQGKDSSFTLIGFQLHVSLIQQISVPSGLTLSIEQV